MLFFNHNRITYEYLIGDKTTKRRTLTSWEIIFVAFIFLFSASFLYSSISNPIIGMIFGLPIIIFISYILLKQFDLFSFILIIFFCNHFRFYENFWNLIFLGLFIIFNSSELFNIKSRNSIFINLFKGLFILNSIGLVFNDSGSIQDILIGFCVFSSFFLIFYLLINYNFQLYDLIRLFKVTTFIIFFELVVSLSQKLGSISIDLPYLPLAPYIEINNQSSASLRILGTFGDFELLAEYAAFLMIFFICLLLYNKISFVIPKSILILIIFSLFILILFTGTRSSMLLIFFALVILLLTHLRLLFSIQLWLAIVVVIIGFNIMIQQGDPLGLKLVFIRISEINVNTTSNQSSDEVMNRDLTFSYAYKRIGEGTWMIGEGYTNGESYKKSLFGKELVEINDYHSLYLSMPIFFGWIGSFFFVLLIISSLLFYLKNMAKASWGSFAFYVSLGLFLTWFSLFINEYKIQFLRYPNYFFLIWFWMAFSINISKNIKNENYYSR